jgi:hypothetical protein
MSPSDGRASTGLTLAMRSFERTRPMGWARIASAAERSTHCSRSQLGGAAVELAPSPRSAPPPPPSPGIVAGLREPVDESEEQREPVDDGEEPKRVKPLLL